MTSRRENLIDFLEEPPPLLINTAYQSGQPGPFDCPPPYTPENYEKAFRIIRCEVCDKEIRIFKDDDRLTVDCNNCGEETPVNALPPEKMFVRCRCSKLFILSSALERAYCTRLSCRKVIKLSPPKKQQAQARSSAPPQTASTSSGSVRPNTRQTQPSNTDSSERRTLGNRGNTRQQQGGRTSATAPGNGKPGPSDCLLPNIPDDDPPSYWASEKAFRIIRCEVCNKEIRILKDDDRLTVDCKNCGEETPLGALPPDKMYVRCSCSKLFVCSSNLDMVLCQRIGCREVIHLSHLKQQAQARPSAPPLTASASGGTVRPNTHQAQPSRADSSACRPSEARGNTRQQQGGRTSATARGNDVPGSSGRTLNREEPATVRRITCDVCKQKLTFTLGKDTRAINCPICKECTAIGDPPPGKKYLRCSCNCLLVFNASTTRVICPRNTCRKTTTVSTSTEPSSSSPAAQCCPGCHRPFQYTQNQGVCEVAFYLIVMLLMKIAILVVVVLEVENRQNVLWIDLSFPFMMMRIIKITCINAKR